MAVMKDTLHIKKQVISNSSSGAYAKRECESIDPYLTLRHQHSKGNVTSISGKQGHFLQDQFRDPVAELSDYKGGESKASLLFENPVESANALLP